MLANEGQVQHERFLSKQHNAPPITKDERRAAWYHLHSSRLMVLSNDLGRRITLVGRPVLLWVLTRLGERRARGFRLGGLPRRITPRLAALALTRNLLVSRLA
jgi:hypothetical protein